MEKITITRIARSNKTSSAGKSYVSLGIQANEYGEQWLNGFGNKSNENWNNGDTVEVTIEKKTVNGKEYLNFETPKSSRGADNSEVLTKLGKIEYKLDTIIKHLSGEDMLDRNSDGSPTPDF